MSFEEKTLKSERIYEGKIVNLRVDTVELPQKKYSKREIIEHAGAVGILAVTKDQKIVLVKQFRKPVEETILEIPAGKLEAKENPADCALRELGEETGYKTSKVKKLLEFYSSPGFTNEVLHIYLAEDLEEGIAHPDEGEFVEPVHIGIEEALEKITKGEIKDAKTIIAILAYKNILNML
ncbi:NUDIX hydrolase [Clostridium formicaceticum]|uniref:ADP-ribose pyrophosphatase n=1 Tax=Clostridium formicaceticum TaxID=1497 RepID=A0AAC9RKZ3_9CLOT|nr:NUDIX hydrolase [Clostridium formicaceticum]AOY77085.1 ADP-ribose pyrophosphatase [Clostridium formicaceticum]ARE87594.1 ADP-ribose pyrophosphatase [Clostridium formicaceticum]